MADGGAGQWDEVILQGPHFTVATPFAKQPNPNCRSKNDWSSWNLESLPESVIPPHQLSTRMRPTHLPVPPRPLEQHPATRPTTASPGAE